MTIGRPFLSFWDRAYRDGDHRDHWEAPAVPEELVTAVLAAEGEGAADSGALEPLMEPTLEPPLEPPGTLPGGLDLRRWLARCRMTSAEPGCAAEPAVDPALRVLDLGCGSGLEAVWMAQRGYRSAGADDSRLALDLARRRAAEKGVEVEWLHASVFDLPLPAASVGLALDRGCFHALHPEDRHLYAEEAARVLAPGAPLLLRGAADEDEEAGLWPVDEVHVDLFFPAATWRRGGFFALELKARAGSLAGRGVWLERRPPVPGDAAEPPPSRW